MQPQTNHAATIPQKVQSCICCIVVFSVAQHHYEPFITRFASQVLRTNSGSFATLAAIRRALSGLILIKVHIRQPCFK